ncbi:carbohydrate-binding family 9-like protein [Polaribacter batillariae]|uniref:Carbohydrate-binding family 9-like protein n=2 Tax=Polaribacter batillariae TaxID=2808900 RepID=A0ABX7T0U4_9FLAO|nr:carbohydrate-binding family 9-like protein [Polaribacter batillariae]QTD39366.1 carbohydrate-binding family 9-like protein [Polaribacter batillariae]
MYLRFKKISVIFYCFSIISCAQSKKEIIPETYVAYKTSEKITIDGKADEADWKKAKWTNNFIDIEGVKTPKYKTNVKMLWNENYYYILAEIKEPHIWADITERDAVIFYNNDFEVFIDPDGDTHNYYELEINALNTTWDLFISKPYREDSTVVLNDWNYTGLQSAVSVQGTINNASDTDKSWTLEIAIPFKDLRTLYKQDNVPRNKFWRVNFSRVNWDHDIKNGKYARKKGKDGKYLHEYNWVWSPIGVVNMHLPENWGYVYFSTKSVDSNESFTIPKDDKIKRELYKIYRKQKSNFEENNSWLTLDKAVSTPIIVDGKTILPELQFHDTGWNLMAKSPFTQKILILKEDGKFISK